MQVSHESQEELIPGPETGDAWHTVMEMQKWNSCIFRVSKQHYYLEWEKEVNNFRLLIYHGNQSESTTKHFANNNILGAIKYFNNKDMQNKIITQSY